MFRTLVTCLLFVIGAVPVFSQVPEATPSRFSVGALGGLAVEQPLNDYVPSRVHLALGELQGSGALIMSGGKPVLEAITGVVLSQSTQPSSRFIVGVTETFRFHSRPRRRFGTYVEAGAGTVSSALFTHIVETDGYFQYLLQVGTGARWRTGRDTFTLGYRFIHFSNHGTTLPNQGLNLHGIVVSYARTL